MRIDILPVGNIDSNILENLREGLTRIFPWTFRIRKEIALPEKSYASRRKQYSASLIHGKIRRLKTGKSALILGVTNVDLYAPKLNVVFGEADMLSGVVIISLARLRQEFYGLQADAKLFRIRAVKEAVHELGHASTTGMILTAVCIPRTPSMIPTGKAPDSAGPVKNSLAYDV